MRPKTARHAVRRDALARRVEHRDRVAHRVGDLLHRRRARLLQVVAADVDRVPARDALDRVGDHVRDQPHRRAGRERVRPARQELLDDVVLRRAGQLRPARRPASSAVDDVERQQPRRRRVDRHRRVHPVQRDAVEQRGHVAAVGDRDADLADLAARQLVVGVVARLRRQVERDRQAGLALRQVRAVQLVGLLRGRMARVGPHHPGLVALGQAMAHARIVWSGAVSTSLVTELRQRAGRRPRRRPAPPATRTRPPRRLRYVGEGDYTEVGETWLGLLRSLALVRPDERVLEIGCGAGVLARPLHRHLGPGARYVGLRRRRRRDRLVPGRLQRPARLLLRARRGPVGDADLVLPFQDATFDVVVMHDVFPHLQPDAVAARLREARRVLVDEGRLFATAYLLDAECARGDRRRHRRDRVRGRRGRDGRRSRARRRVDVRHRRGVAARPRRRGRIQDRRNPPRILDAARGHQGVPGHPRGAPVTAPSDEQLDVLHLGRPNVICCHRVGDVLIDPGPQSCEATLLAALGDRVPQAILLTHIHLDHAGATGALVRRWPHLVVAVHERGARHVVDPSKLVASATRLYGDDMERLWGEIVPVPEDRLHRAAGRRALDGWGDDGPWHVAYTPGHAQHHVSYLHEPSGTVYAGDVAGVPDRRRPDHAADAAARHRPRALARLARHDRGVGAAAAGDHALRHLRRPAAPPRRPARGARPARRLVPRPRRRRVRAARARLDHRARRAPNARTAYFQGMPPDALYPGLARYWATPRPGALTCAACQGVTLMGRCLRWWSSRGSRDPAQASEGPGT